MAALFASCPHCGSPTLFNGAARLAAQCRVCGLDLSAFSGGGRTGAFVTALVAVAVAALALKVDDWLAPPLLLQAVLWSLLTPLAVIVALRFWLAWRIARAYRRQQASGE